jgi:hypothetical protein
MPCRNDSALFPANFEVDTPFLSQALAEHNADRVGDGLPVADFLQLSGAERHDVLWRAQKIKSAARYTPIQISPHVPVPPVTFFSLGAYLLALGIVGVVSLLWKILG